jgi:cytochrome c peroxidase
MRLRRALLAPIASCIGLAAAGAEPLVTFDERELETIFSLSPLPAPLLDATNRVDGNPEAIALGARLFSDTRLSGRGEFSCATCHDSARGWADGKEVAIAAGVGTRNTPSLWNVAHQRWYFWDGRADSLWSQALKPIESTVELDGSRLQVAHVVHDDPTLRAGYEALFGQLPELRDTQRFPRTGGPLAGDEERQLNWWRMAAADRAAITELFANVGKTIAAFEATIRSAPAPFDRFVGELEQGKRPTAISAAAQRGLKTFIGAGNCVLCHSGPNFTNKEFHDVRVPQRSAADAAHDAGRGGGLSLLLEDEFVSAGYYSDHPQGTRAMNLVYLDFEGAFGGHFRTPSLRNVANTAPYMHAGQYRTLEDVVRHYSTLADAAPPAEPEHVELLVRPFPLDERAIADLVAFLESLTSG